MIMHIGEVFAQDKWQIKPGLTLSAGVRYDIEVFPYDPAPLGNPNLTKYPVDKGNVAPRLGMVWNPDGAEQVGHPSRLRPVLRPHAARNGRQLPDRPQILAVVHGQLPGVGP